MPTPIPCTTSFALPTRSTTKIGLSRSTHSSSQSRRIRTVRCIKDKFRSFLKRPSGVLNLKRRSPPRRKRMMRFGLRRESLLRWLITLLERKVSTTRTSSRTPNILAGPPTEIRFWRALRIRRVVSMIGLLLVHDDSVRVQGSFSTLVRRFFMRGNTFESRRLGLRVIGSTSSKSALRVRPLIIIFVVVLAHKILLDLLLVLLPFRHSLRFRPNLNLLFTRYHHFPALVIVLTWK
jgi:hypothetical protein